MWRLSFSHGVKKICVSIVSYMMITNLTDNAAAEAPVLLAANYWTDGRKGMIMIMIAWEFLCEKICVLIVQAHLHPLLVPYSILYHQRRAHAAIKNQVQ